MQYCTEIIFREGFILHIHYNPDMKCETFYKEYTVANIAMEVCIVVRANETADVMPSNAVDVHVVSVLDERVV